MDGPRQESIVRRHGFPPAQTGVGVFRRLVVEATAVCDAVPEVGGLLAASLPSHEAYLVVTALGHAFVHVIQLGGIDSPVRVGRHVGGVRLVAAGGPAN